MAHHSVSLAGMRSCLFALGPFQLELDWPPLSFPCWKSDLPECPDDFPSFSLPKIFNFTSTRAKVLELDISWRFALVHIREAGRLAGRMKGDFPYWKYVSRALWSTLACNRDFCFLRIPDCFHRWPSHPNIKSVVHFCH